MSTRELHLEITSYTCTCGHHWTHSYLRFPNGGTPTPLETSKLPVTTMRHSSWNVHACHSCVPQALGPGWLRTAPAWCNPDNYSTVQPHTPPKQTAKELEEEMLK